MNKESQLEKILKERKISPAELNAIIDQIKNPDLRPRRAKHHWGTNHIRIGLVGDIHIGSKYEDAKAREDLFKRFKREGVEAVYITGDITEGYNMRPGHSFECYLHGADEQIKGVIEKTPLIKKPIYFITGDHDYSHFKRQGIEIGKYIEQQRDDMHYLGMFNATIELSKKTTLMLQHPGKGTAYAISYQIQKLIESMSGGEKPSILAVGHYHKIEYLFYRNVHAFQTGTLEKQTPWMRRMNLSAHIGGWILDIYTKKSGSIDKLEMKMYPYY